jgi:hypothetical protein
MSFIDRELARLNRALDDGVGNPRYPEIYAAQQALAWVLEPNVARSPFAYITGNAEASEDCWADSHRAKLSDTGPLELCRQHTP